MGNDHLHDQQIGGLPLPVRRQLAGKCERCEEPSLPGKKLCQTHVDDARARRRRADKKRRDHRRRKRLCVDCNKPAKKRRCRGCWKRSRGANQTKEGASNTWRVDPGTTWKRFRGKGRRGRLTREEQIDEDKRDASFAVAEIKKFLEKANVLKRAEVMDMPTIQRAALRREVGQHLGLAGRMLDELAEKYG